MRSHNIYSFYTALFSSRSVVGDSRELDGNRDKFNNGDAFNSNNDDCVDAGVELSELDCEFELLVGCCELGLFALEGDEFGFELEEGELGEALGDDELDGLPLDGEELELEEGKTDASNNGDVNSNNDDCDDEEGFSELLCDCCELGLFEDPLEGDELGFELDEGELGDALGDDELGSPLEGNGFELELEEGNTDASSPPNKGDSSPNKDDCDDEEGCWELEPLPGC